jgi:hypothetical protein
MNVRIEQQEEDTSANQLANQTNQTNQPDLQIDLLSGCSYLAENAGESSLAAAFLQLEEGTGPTGKKDTLKKVIEAARHEGLQTLILRPQAQEWSGIAEYLPVVAELRNGRYLIVSAINIGADGLPVSLATLAVVSRLGDEAGDKETVSFADFQKRWTGKIKQNAFEKLF